MKSVVEEYAKYKFARDYNPTMPRSAEPEKGQPFTGEIREDKSIVVSARTQNKPPDVIYSNSAMVTRRESVYARLDRAVVEAKSRNELRGEDRKPLQGRGMELPRGFKERSR